VRLLEFPEVEVTAEGVLLPEGKSMSTAAVDGVASSIIMTACLRLAPAEKSVSGRVDIGVIAGTRKRFSEEARGKEVGDVNGVDAVSDKSLRALGGRVLVMRGLVLERVGLAGVIVGVGDVGWFGRLTLFDKTGE
jgi:hypothetical protein